MKNTRHALTKENSLLLVVDIQERLSPTMDAHWLNATISQLGLLALYARLEKLPVILTEQYPRGLGPTRKDVLALLENIPYTRCEKNYFSCADDPTILAHLKKYPDKKIILTGMETHICILLTALGLVHQGFDVFVPQDAVIARKKDNHQNGLVLMQDAGAIITNTETLVFQMMSCSGGDTFKSVSNYLKNQKN